MAEQQGAFADAIAAFRTSLNIEPDSSFALAGLAMAEAASGRSEDALQHSAEALKRAPAYTQLYLLRAGVYRSQGRTKEALHEAELVEASAPNDAMAHLAAADIYGAYHKDAEAMAAYDRALAITPQALIYLDRAQHRPKSDKAGRQADVAAALKLEPTLPGALEMKANFQVEDGDYKGAVETYTSALAKTPDNPALITARGIAYARAGETARAMTDFAAARAKATSPQALNNLCWSKATAGVALDSALADCNAAVDGAPAEASYLDSRGFVFLRLGRTDKAIADYDRALAKNPRLPSSLYGRAVAWARKGAVAKSRSDAEAALRIDPDIRAAYDGYGVKL